MTKNKKIVSQMILVLFIFEIILLKFRGEKFLLSNMVFLFPVGVLLPKIWNRFREIKNTIYAGVGCSIVLELFAMLGGGETDILYAVAEGIIGVILGYTGYFFAEMYN